MFAVIFVLVVLLNGLCWANRGSIAYNRRVVSRLCAQARVHVLMTACNAAARGHHRRAALRLCARPLRGAVRLRAVAAGRQRGRAGGLRAEHVAAQHVQQPHGQLGCVPRHGRRAGVRDDAGVHHRGHTGPLGAGLCGRRVHAWAAVNTVGSREPGGAGALSTAL